MKLPENQLYHQMHMTYLRCLSTFRFCPDIWIAFAEYESSFDKQRAAAILHEAVRVMPRSVLLRIACCQFFEEHELMAECEAEYERVLRECPTSLAWTTYLGFTHRQKGVEACRALFRRACAEFPCSGVYQCAGRRAGQVTHSVHRGVDQPGPRRRPTGVRGGTGAVRGPGRFRAELRVVPGEDAPGGAGTEAPPRRSGEGEDESREGLGGAGATGVSIPRGGAERGHGVGITVFHTTAFRAERGSAALCRPLRAVGSRCGGSL